MKRTRMAVLALALLVAAAAGSCAMQSEPARVSADPVASYVESMRTANRLADQALENGETDAARHALEGALAADAPASMAADDVRVVRQDLLFRLSQIELASGDAARAADRADEGLNIGIADDVFTANLYVARGRAREALAREREAAGDYFDALEINERLLQAALGHDEEGR
jgi:hypothetical protein